MQKFFLEITALWHTIANQFFNDESEGILIYCNRTLKHPKLYQMSDFLTFQMQIMFYHLRS